MKAVEERRWPHPPVVWGRAPRNSMAAVEESPSPDGKSPIPPPFFPPGPRERRAAAVSDWEGSATLPEDALVFPDDAGFEAAGSELDAGVSVRTEAPAEAPTHSEPEVEVMEGVLVEQAGEATAPHTVADLLEGLARELRESGSVSLRPERVSTPLEGLLRGILAGYQANG